MSDKNNFVGITGASGFVGSSLLKYLKEKNYIVRGITRHQSLTKTLDYNSIIRVSYHNKDELITAFKGIDTIIHCAARSLDWGKRRDFYSSNVQIVKNLVAAAAKNRVKRIIHISTANVENYGQLMLDELSNKRVPQFKYSKTKWEGENALKELCSSKNIEYIIVRPSAIYGPGDIKWSYQMIDRIKHSWWPLVNGGRAKFTPLYIKNLCSAIELTLNTDKINSVFNLTDNIVISWRDFSDRIAKIIDVLPKYKNYPFLLAISVAVFSKIVHDMIVPKKEPFITPYRVIRSSKDFLYSCNNAIQKLGYQPISDINLNLKETIEWYNSLKE